MTPKEKAIELYENFMPYVSIIDGRGNYIEHKYAKQCALICVDEIMKVTAPYCDRHEDYYIQLKQEMTAEYWEQVKQEIELL